MFERFTDRARGVVTGAQDEARQLRHRHIGTEHLLLALLADDAGLAGTVLRDAGVYPEQVRADIRAIVGTDPDPLGAADAEALRAIGIDLDAVRSKVEETFGEGALEPPHTCQPRRRGLFLRGEPGPLGPVRGHIPFTARAKKVLELSLREALHLRHKHIGTEHILLGLLREGDGLAAKVLSDAGLRLDDLRGHVLDALHRAA
ncbi:Clp protease [Phytohabitans rumicis]|uniref:Clp protease n=1 Tax=Phytohabitans rumicis TaxID=1076125 RepID=A0A6V8L2F9_9ACTN|nr:Clp protease N-terminal domain-containing protein [Phytohabitans rumicis]GFJ89118.1 Clp protease [Phytohabitans rumicis]